MKICCIIDSLGSGGAQRQMTWLVRALVSRGHEIQLLTYYDYDHFLPLIREVGVEPESIATASSFGRFWAARKKVREFGADVIISYLNTPSILAVYASLMPARIPVVVSERVFEEEGPNNANRIRFNIFRAADCVV